MMNKSRVCVHAGEDTVDTCRFRDEDGFCEMNLGECDKQPKGEENARKDEDCISGT